MLRGLFGISCLVVAGGCVALNAGFEESAGSTGGTEPSDTGRLSAGESDSDPSAGGSSAVTTVTPGDSSGETADPTGPSGSSDGDPSGDSGDDSGGSSGSSGGESDTSVGDSSETGGPVCIPSASAQVMDDAFLLTCPGEGCAVRNYGQTDEGSLADGDTASSVLLLALPVMSASATEVHVTLSFIAEGDLANGEFSISAYPVSPPCNWSEGPHDNEPLQGGESGVTAASCDGDLDNPSPWLVGEDGSIWDHIDPTWDPEYLFFESGDVGAGELFSETMTLERPIPGSTPQAVLITSDALSFGQLTVFSGEDMFDPPFVDVVSECP